MNELTPPGQKFSGQETTTFEETIETLKVPAVRNSSVPSEICQAVVNRWLDPNGFVKLDGQLTRAERAVSCLLVPQAGDLVLVCKQGQDSMYVLAVLARETHQTAEISVIGAETLNICGSSLHFAAEQELTMKATKGIFDFPKLFHAISEKVSLAAGHLLSRSRDRTCISGRSTENFEHRMISVAKVDLRRSKQTIEEVEETFTMRTKMYLSSVKNEVVMIARRIMFS